MLTSLSDLFRPKGKRARGATAEARLMEAYTAVFDGRGNKEDADLVLLDLLRVTEYLYVAEAPVGAEAASAARLHEMNGARRVGGRIAYMLNWPAAKFAEIQRAIAAEDRVDAEEGIL